MGEFRTAAAVNEAGSIPQGLTRQEDDELRRLNWFSEIGVLSGRKWERMIELRLRDRRADVRPPREFGGDDRPAPQKPRRKWLRFAGR